MHYQGLDVVFQEVPGEISLCFTISGCPLRCSGCHSPYLWKKETGTRLTESLFRQLILCYKEYATCILFMGGEWHQKELVQLLEIARKEGYKTCLYTGEEELDLEIVAQLNWIKTGHWDLSLGGLDSTKTNQKFIEVKTNKILNHLFLKTEHS